MLKFSIIVPVYNTPKEYLQKCIDSIISQTYSNWECIIVDDGSSMEYDAFTDSRIRYIKQSNSGVFAAYRNGFQHTTGDFIIHCDSDDWLNEGYFQEVVDNIDSRYDTYMMNTTSVFDDGYKEKSIWPNKGLKDYKGKEWFEALCERKKTSWALWGVTLKREFLQKTYDAIGESKTIVPSYDCLVSVAYSVFSNGVKYIPFDGFYYRINPNGVSFSVVTPAKLERTIDSEELVFQSLQKLFISESLEVNLLDKIRQELGKNFVESFYQCDGYEELYSQFVDRVDRVYGVELAKPKKTIRDILLPKNTIRYRFMRFLAMKVYRFFINK